MINSLRHMWRERMLLMILLFLVQQICATNEQDHACPPSSCGKITNIRYPFRLQSDPKRCGDNRYELTCENNVTVLYLYSGKYLVQAINHDNFTIRVVDPGVQEANYSSLPRYFLSQSNFSDTYIYNYMVYDIGPYQASRQRLIFQNSSYEDVQWELVFQHIVFMNCSHQVDNNSKYVDTSPYINWHSKGYIYAIAGDLRAEDFQIGCHVKLVAPTSWWGLYTNKYKYSYTEIYRALIYGFEISWMHVACENDHCGNSSYGICCIDNSEQPRCLETHCRTILGVLHFCDDKGLWSQLGSQIGSFVKGNVHNFWIGLLGRIKWQNPNNYDYDYNYFSTMMGNYILPLFWAGKFVFGVILFIVLLIYKWQKRHLSIYQNIEHYLERNSLMPIRYSYNEIKKMVGGFKNKLGEGGYGSVFKGKLRSGLFVAIKMLGKSKGNGQDFINEVATIGRIHHHNVVRLIGFCVEGSKRALVYEFMPNGSLDKFIFSKDGNRHLSYEEIYNISIGVARGIAYLHHGCEMQILHFDIKPHNILLDENFTPKVSDFGLAKLHPVDNSIITMTAARGTIGYMAPELFYKNIGVISHKADVYSFGMLLMEMTSKRKNLNPNAEHSSQLYFPFWIYNQLGTEKDIEMEDVTEEEKKIAKKMIIIALWCIQLKPNDRPSMNKVVEMLEGDIENLEIPPKPSLHPHETPIESQKINSNQIMTSNIISSSCHSMP